MQIINKYSAEELASHSIRANHELIFDLARAKDAQEIITFEMPDFFGIITENGKVIKGNAAFSKLAQVDTEDVFGVSFDSLFLEESWKIISHSLQSAREIGSEPVSFELAVDKISPGTIVHWTFARFSAASDRRGALFTFIGKDISMLKDFERKLSTVFSAIPLAVMTIGQGKTIEWPYSKYSEFLLYRQELENISAEDAIFGLSIPFLNPMQLEGVKALLAQINEEEEWYDMAKEQFPKEIPIGPAGSTEPVAWRGLTYNPIIRSGRVEKILVVIEDITERVKLRAEMVKTSTREGKLAQTIVDLQETDPMFLNSCLDDVDGYIAEIDKQIESAAPARVICNSLHGIKGVARTVNLRAFKELIHETENRILATAPNVDSPFLSKSLSDIMTIKKEWMELRRLIRAFKAPVDGATPLPGMSAEGVTKIIALREEIQSAAEFLKSEVPTKYAAQFDQMISKIRTLGRIPFSTLEPKLSSFFDVNKRRLGKRAILICDWGNSELDRAMAPMMCEVFYHLLTNALDHGVESLARRSELKKSDEATIKISALVDTGTINFQVEDDGKGLDVEAIKAKALERGLIKTVEGLSDEYVWNLILNSGFSTTEKVTDTSGRGIGLAAVNERVKKLGGCGLKIAWSKSGHGTRFSFSINQ